MDQDVLIAGEKINLTCPFTSVRLEKPVIANCCTRKHPYKAMSEAPTLNLRNRRTHGQFKCPFCGVNILQNDLVLQPQIEELLAKTSDDVNYVYLKDEKFYEDDKGQKEILVLFSFRPSPPVDPTPVPKKAGSNIPRTTSVIQVITPPKESLKRGNGMFGSSDERELKKIRVDERAIDKMVEKHKRGKKTGTVYYNVHRELEDFWTNVQEMYRNRFGELQK